MLGGDLTRQLSDDERVEKAMYGDGLSSEPMGPMEAPRREEVAHGEASKAPKKSYRAIDLKTLRRRRWWGLDERAIVVFAASRISPRRSRYPEKKPPLRSEAALSQEEAPRKSCSSEAELNTAKQRPQVRVVAGRCSFIRRSRASK